MMKDEEMKKVRAELLKANEQPISDRKINGIDFVEVQLQADGCAILLINCFNENQVTEVCSDINPPQRIFKLEGGQRRKAGLGEEEVQIVEIDSDTHENIIKLVISPIGDYSTYTLSIGEIYEQWFDPIFSDVQFRFRPGCFNTICLQEQKSYKPAKEEPLIDYIAKDYDTFKHTMLSSMSEKVPGWVPSSEADLDMVLIELISAAADELSDFQDRVMNEAYISTAKKRVSIARHARIMDYYIYEGHQSNAWLIVELYQPDNPVSFKTPGTFKTLPAHSEVGTPDGISFSSQTQKSYLHSLLNRLSLYTWDNAVTYLPKGSTSAYIRLGEFGGDPEEVYADLRRMIIDSRLTHLVIQEWKNPKTGDNLREAGVKSNRQLLKLVSDEDQLKVLRDPITDQFCLEVHWSEGDMLEDDYYFTVKVETDFIDDVSMFHGNLVMVYHGDYTEATFIEPGESKATHKNCHLYERIGGYTFCHIPENPLAYRDVYNGCEPNGEQLPVSTVSVTVNGEVYQERISLVHSKGDDAHFIVETDENQRSSIKFGNGKNGRALPKDAVVKCFYQVGIGNTGNVGADSITTPRELFRDIVANCWNPFDVTNGRDPQTVQEILRDVPEAYHARQLRAVTVNEKIDDYEKRATELPQIQDAHATYLWTGSWRVVQVSVDPVGLTEITEELKTEVKQYIDSVRLIGDQVIIQQPAYIPLKIDVHVCVHPSHWIGNVRAAVFSEFSSVYTSEGKKAFFHPDHWTFGATLSKEMVIGKLLEIDGVADVLSNSEYPLKLQRWGYEGQTNDELLIQPNEIIQVLSNPNEPEKGFVYFHFRGGRQ